ncbi:STAS domain-containing protein [Planococcus salinus]|uniref:STAS domain-containing protein n=1 Tax=Planococcus salinus TaxID=1848460 RepID=A0A3M8P6K4_9BACL|nr:STAS domain-containing protein [Planococcus salinus]RNF39323.1 STAS domain-containing protein [Planococcus salinus]
MDQQQEMKELRDLVKYYEKLVKNMAAPIIPSIVPHTILVPIAGVIFRDRFEAIQSAVLKHAGENRETQRVIFDFTGVEREDIETFDYNELASELFQLNDALKLMGLRPIYVGFNPRFVREIVHAGIHVELEAYNTFRAALKELLNENEQPFYSL